MRPIKTLQIETINKCNAKCIFCAVPLQTKPRELMSMDLFKKIIDDCKGLEIKSIYPFLNGEPLLDPFLAERIEYINKTLPKISVGLFSNGHLLNKRKRKELSKVKIDYINFSINAVSDRERLNLMNLPLTRTIENITAYKQMSKNTYMTASFILNPLYLSKTSITEAQDLWVDIGVSPTIFFEGNWAGKTQKVINPARYCTRLNDEMTILSDGQANLCCQDIDGEVDFGNLKYVSVQEAWENQKRYNCYLLNIKKKKKEIALCNQCTSI
jgi:sulfatase maturation enzyme AslB (radical SAM superfamily)